MFDCEIILNKMIEEKKKCKNPFKEGAKKLLEGKKEIKNRKKEENMKVMKKRE